MKGLKVMTDECALFSPQISSYVDGELDAGHSVDVEAHAIRCSTCTERIKFLQTMRASIKRVSNVRAPDAFRARMEAAMGAEKVRVREADRESFGGAKLVGWKYAAALAAAASVVLSVAAVKNRQDTASGTAHPSIVESSIGFDGLLDELVALHANPLPPETTNPEELTKFDPLVGVPVRRPAFQPLGVFNGARVHAMRERRAALLQYTMEGNHRMTVYVFDPRAVVMQATRLQPRVVRERPVYVGKLRGYSVAAAEKGGVGYALATDLGDDRSAQLVLAASQP
jgi:hypothetical protein